MHPIQTLLGGLIILAAPSVAAAATWNVDQANSGCSDSVCSPCCTIQGAVNKCFGGDMVSIAPGTYAEQVDVRDMFVMGNISFMAANGPGTVLVAPTSGHTLRHGGSHDNAVNVMGVDFSSASGSACIYLDHQGAVFLSDVTANNCGYTAFVLDNTGNVTMERCTGNNSEGHGIAVDGAAYASLTDCTANSNSNSGIVVYTLGTSELINPTTVGNTVEGISVDAVGSTTITGATVTDNGRTGIAVDTSSTLTISDSTITGSSAHGIDVHWYDSDPVDSVTLTNLDINNNGTTNGGSGVRLRDVTGPTTITNCDSNDNGSVSQGGDGFTAEAGIVGDIEIHGGEAIGNGDDGYDLRVTGSTTVTGVTASNNFENGVVTEISGTAFFQDCVASANEQGFGFDIQWQEPDHLDGATMIDCTAHNNGLAWGGNGIRVKHVTGPVTVVGARTNGNYWTGVRVDDAAGSVLIRDAVANSNFEDGIKIDADAGPVTVLDCVADGNTADGLIVNRETVDVETLLVRRSAFVANGGTGVSLSGLGGSGSMSVKCNDIADNYFGVYLDSTVTVDARKVWWGNTTGPSSQGPGTGDGIFAEPGGTITYNPWLEESFLSPLTNCEMFGSGFESGLFEEWDVIVD